MLIDGGWVVWFAQDYKQLDRFDRIDLRRPSSWTWLKTMSFCNSAEGFYVNVLDSQRKTQERPCLNLKSGQVCCDALILLVPGLYDMTSV